VSELRLPSGLWAEGDAAVLASWLYADGDQVPAGAIVAEIMVQKSSFEIVAPRAGILRIGTAKESEVRQGEVIGRIQ
jgi:pyruvate/2-oxoglutarate dehydrogenase complex dihydrolipoamide acyltransferase (E2) component